MFRTNPFSGSPCIPPHLLLDAPIFSHSYRFSRPCFYQIKDLIWPEMSCRAGWGSSFTVPIYTARPLSPSHLLCISCTSPHPTRQLSARPHTWVPSTDVMGSIFVEVKPTIAVRRLHTPLSKQWSFAILSTPHSLEVSWCSQHPAAAQGLSTRAETLAWDLLLVIRHFLICKKSISSFVITQLTTSDEKLKTDLENTILKNQRKSKVIPCPRNSLWTRIYTDWITIGRIRNTTILESLTKKILNTLFDALKATSLLQLFQSKYIITYNQESEIHN